MKNAALLTFILVFSCSSIKCPFDKVQAKALWSQTIRNDDYGTSLNITTCDSEGNIYIVGTSSGTTDLGNGIILSDSSSSYPFLIKYNPFGIPQWARMVKSNAGVCVFSGIDIDSEGNIIVAGSVNGVGEFDLGDGVIVHSTIDKEKAIIGKYKKDGAAIWVQTVESNDGQSTYTNVCLDSEDNIIAVGIFNRTSTYNLGNNLTAEGQANGSYCGAIVKYEKTGMAVWAKSVKSEGLPSTFTSIAIDGEGNIYVAGMIQGEGKYILGQNIEIDWSDNCATGIVVKYDINGNDIWGKPIITETGSEIQSIAFEENGNIYIAGEIFSGEASFGEGVVLKGVNFSDRLFLAKISTDGKAQWAKTVEGESSSILKSIAVDEKHRIIGVGFVQGKWVNTFANEKELAGSKPNGWSAVVIIFNSEGLCLDASSVLSEESSSYFHSVSVCGKNAFISAGIVFGESKYDFGSGIMIDSEEGQYQEISIVKYKY